MNSSEKNPTRRATLEEYLSKENPRALYIFKRTKYTDFTYEDLKIVMDYETKIWSDGTIDENKFKDFNELKNYLRQVYSEYYDSETDSWDLKNTESHEILAAYILERKLIDGIENQVNIPSNIHTALGHLLNMKYSKRKNPTIT